MTGFHWQDGWFFKRLDNGAVSIKKYRRPIEGEPLEVEATIPPAEWASIVASVSAFGETGPSFRMFEAAQIG